MRTNYFFRYPYHSSQFGIIQAEKLSGKFETAYVSEVQCKLLSLPYKGMFVLFSMNIIST